MYDKGLLATLIAKGCNIGMVKMAALVPGIRPGTLRQPLSTPSAAEHKVHGTDTGSDCD